MRFFKTLAAAGLLLAGAFTAGAAQARDVYWSVGIQAPVAGVGVGTVVSNVPQRSYPPAYGYVAAPVYPAYGGYPVYHPAPVVYAPAPVVRYRSAPRYVVVPPHAPRGWHGHRHGHRHGHGHGHR